MERLRELNPSLKLGPRYSAFLAKRNEPTKTAPLRICLDSELSKHIRIDTSRRGHTSPMLEIHKDVMKPRKIQGWGLLRDHT